MISTGNKPITSTSAHQVHSSKLRLSSKQVPPPIRQTLAQDYQRFTSSIAQRVSARETQLRESFNALSSSSHSHAANQISS